MIAFSWSYDMYSDTHFNSQHLFLIEIIIILQLYLCAFIRPRGIAFIVNNNLNADSN